MKMSEDWKVILVRVIKDTFCSNRIQFLNEKARNIKINLNLVYWFDVHDLNNQHCHRFLKKLFKLNTINEGTAYILDKLVLWNDPIECTLKSYHVKWKVRLFFA